MAPTLHVLVLSFMSFMSVTPKSVQKVSALLIENFDFLNANGEIIYIFYCFVFPQHVRSEFEGL